MRRRLWFGPTAALTLIAGLSASAAQAQSTFEVASIKLQPWTGQGRVGEFIHGNTFSAEHVCLADLVEYAWNLKRNQVSGGPAWAQHGVLATAQLYAVAAKSAGDAELTEEQARMMLRSLLAERFQLKVREGSKDFPVYLVVVAKGGPKLKESAANAKFALNVDGSVSGGQLTRITGQHVAMPMLLEHVEHSVGRPVVDHTSLTGFYDFTIEYGKDAFEAGAAADPLGSSIFTSMQSQLGLKMEAGTAPLKTIVIESAEKPSEN